MQEGIKMHEIKNALYFIPQILKIYYQQFNLCSFIAALLFVIALTIYFCIKEYLN